MSYPKIDFLYLSEDDMIAAGVKDMKGCVEAMEEMFKLMKIGITAWAVSTAILMGAW